jgi:hypothetical protein
LGAASSRLECEPDWLRLRLPSVCVGSRTPFSRSFALTGCLVTPVRLRLPSSRACTCRAEGRRLRARVLRGSKCAPVSMSCVGSSALSSAAAAERVRLCVGATVALDNWTGGSQSVSSSSSPLPANCTTRLATGLCACFLYISRWCRLCESGEIAANRFGYSKSDSWLLQLSSSSTSSSLAL